MELHEDDMADPFDGQLGRCPRCGAAFPSPSGAEVSVGVYTYAVDLGGGRAGAESGTTFFGKCAACSAFLRAPGEGRPEWDGRYASQTVWMRHRSPVFGS